MQFLYIAENVPVSRCPFSFLEIVSRCFYYNPDLLTWQNARNFCKSLSADLVVINSPEQASFYVEFNPTVVPFYDASVPFWIGATDADAENNWLWITGQSAESTLQMLGVVLENAAERDYLYLNPTNGIFIADGETEMHRSVCEWQG